MDSQEFTKIIAEYILSKKGYDIKALDLRNVTTIADYFIICSADSDTQVRAIADEIDKNLRENGIKYTNREGYDTLNWVLLDYFDVIVHIFKKEAREYYNLEKFWGDAPVTEIKDELVIEQKPKRKTRSKVEPIVEDKPKRKTKSKDELVVAEKPKRKTRIKDEPVVEEKPKRKSRSKM